MDKKHTKTPFSYEMQFKDAYIKAEDNTEIAHIFYTHQDNTEANARFIVTACNNFESMREALEAVNAYLEASYPTNLGLKSRASELIDEVLSQIEKED